MWFRFRLSEVLHKIIYFFLSTYYSLVLSDTFPSHIPIGRLFKFMNSFWSINPFLLYTIWEKFHYFFSLMLIRSMIPKVVCNTRWFWTIVQFTYTVLAESPGFDRVPLSIIKYRIPQKTALIYIAKSISLKKKFILTLIITSSESKITSSGFESFFNFCFSIFRFKYFF